MKKNKTAKENPKRDAMYLTPMFLSHFGFLPFNRLSVCKHASKQFDLEQESATSPSIDCQLSNRSVLSIAGAQSPCAIEDLIPLQLKSNDDDQSESLAQSLEGIDRINYRASHLIRMYYAKPDDTQSDKTDLSTVNIEELDGGCFKKLLESFASEEIVNKLSKKHSDDKVEESLGSYWSDAHSEIRVIPVLNEISCENQDNQKSDKKRPNEDQSEFQAECHLIWLRKWSDLDAQLNLHIPTSDVTVIVHPVVCQGGFRIHIASRHSFSVAGPLVSGVVVSWHCLAPAIRLTTINVGRRKRLQIPYDHANTPQKQRMQLFHDIVTRFSAIRAEQPPSSPVQSPKGTCQTPYLSSVCDEFYSNLVSTT